MEYVLSEIQKLGESYDPSAPESSIYHFYFELYPSHSWNQKSFEGKYNVLLPDDLVVLWNKTHKILLFETDLKRFHSGIFIVGPEEVPLVRKAASQFFGKDLRSGDIVIGYSRVLHDFFIVLRCDPQKADFGCVFVTQEMDRRSEWKYAATSLSDFLGKYLQSSGKEFWHRKDAIFVLD